MKKNFKDLLQVAKKLRGENGCPWDREQTIESMLKYVEEEVEEVKQAVENEDDENLREELGDVLFQLVMIAQIASEKGSFKMEDVIEDIYTKIVSRHTWVFGEDTASTPEEAMKIWKENKEKEKQNKKK